MRHGADNLLDIEARVEGIEDRAQLEEGIGGYRELDVVSERHGYAVALANADTLQAARESIAFSIEVVVGQLGLLMAGYDTADGQWLIRTTFD